MSRRETLVAAFLITVGCMTMVGDVLRIPLIKALGLATGSSPAPKVFTAQDGFETYANRFFLEWRDAGGAQKSLELTPEVYGTLTGPYNRRNVYGAVFSYAPVLDALARRPMTFDELARAPECSALDRGRLRQAVFGMAALGNILPALPTLGEDTRRKDTDRFNQAVLRTPIRGATDTFFASPVLGAGVALNLIDRLFLAAPRDAAQAIAKASAAIAASGLKLRKGDKVLESAADIEAYVKDRTQFFFTDFLPFLKMLGVAD